MSGTVRALCVALSVFALLTARAEDPRFSGCPLNGDFGLPAYFRYEPDGRTRTAEAGVVLPARFEQVRRLADDVNAYPEWLLLDRDGSPLLHDVSFDPQTRRGGVDFGKSDDTRIEGVLSRTDGDSFLELRFEMLDGEAVTDAAIEVGVSEYGPCPATSLVTVRVRWKVGLLAYWFANDGLLSMPALLGLMIRDDLAARVLEERTDVRKAILETAPEWAAFVMQDGSEVREVSLTHFEPGVVRVKSESTTELRKLLLAGAKGRKTKPGPFILSCIDALSTHDRIVGYHATFWVEGMQTPVRSPVFAGPGGVDYVFEIGTEGFSISCYVRPE